MWICFERELIVFVESFKKWNECENQLIIKSKKLLIHDLSIESIKSQINNIINIYFIKIKIKINF